MATSGSYNWQATRVDIIKSALRKCGALGDFEVPTTEQTTVASMALQAMVKAWQAFGMPVWSIDEYTIPTSALATGVVSIGVGETVDTAKPLKVLEAFIRRSGNDIPLSIYDRFSFARLTNKNLTGIPTILYYQPLETKGNLHCYPKPNTDTQTNTNIIIHYQSMFDDMDSDGNDLGFPPEWAEAVIYGLAVRLAPEYGLSINERQQLKLEAKEFLDTALSFGTEEGSLFLQPY